MKNKKRIFGFFGIFALAFSVFVTGYVSDAAKKKAAINLSEVVLKKGETRKLKITGTKKKVIWKSSDPSVVKVTSKGKITALGTGKAAVTGKVKKKSYTCRVSVTAGEEKEMMTEIEVVVGDTVFPAKLYDNETAKTLIEQFPMTVDMSELNGNEKYVYLEENLPKNAEKPEKIHQGDLMLYGSDCLVLFYETFSTSYSYTRLGYLEDTEGLKKALGKNNAEVTFQLP